MYKDKHRETQKCSKERKLYLALYNILKIQYIENTRYETNFQATTMLCRSKHYEERLLSE